jgi:iron complex transport system substrate-binding protein
MPRQAPLAALALLAPLALLAQPARPNPRVADRVHLAIALLAIMVAVAAQPAAAALSVVDDSGQTVSLPRPAQRIVALAPHITEQLFAIGVGERIVGTTEYADFPPAAQAIPRVGRAHSLDLERISAAAPDLIVVWGSGFPPALVDALRRLRVPVYINEPGALESVATSLERLGTLTAAPRATAAASDFRARLAELRGRYAGRSEVRVFYQVWSQPLMTLGRPHVLTEAIVACGGRNVFGTLAPIAPHVSTEAVLAAAPQLIATAEADAKPSAALDMWRRFATLPAVRNELLVTLDGNKINRHSPRMLDEIAVLCEHIERARKKG